MTTYIALLRGINVSGQKLIKMAELAELFKSLNLVDVKTYIQSGNIVFKSDVGDKSELRQTIEKAIEQKYGFFVRVFMRTAEEWREVVADNPFLKEPEVDISGLYVCFLDAIVSQENAAFFAAGGPDEERVHFSDYELYLHYPNGTGRSKWSNNFFEKKLGVDATSRNWRTVLKLASMCE